MMHKANGANGSVQDQFAGLETMLGMLHQHPVYHSERRLLWQSGTCQLYHYKSKLSRQKIPLIIVFALVNTPDILDLSAKRSFIRSLIKKNFDVYLFDWGSAQVNLSLSQYIDILDQAIAYLVKCNDKPLSMLSICQGGVLSLLAKNVRSYIHRLILVTTPIDFHAANFNMAKLVRKLDLNVFEGCSIIPSAWLAAFFISLNPVESMGKKFLRFLQNYHDKTWLQQFLQLEKWFLTVPPQSSQLLQEFIQLFFHQNNLMTETWLADLRMPLLNIMATRDKLISQDACLGLRAYQQPGYTEYLMPTGHLGLYLNPLIREETVDFIAKWARWG